VNIQLFLADENSFLFYLFMVDHKKKSNEARSKQISQFRSKIGFLIKLK
jgi:hypothetical protein